MIYSGTNRTRKCHTAYYYYNTDATDTTSSTETSGTTENTPFGYEISEFCHITYIELAIRVVVERQRPTYATRLTFMATQEKHNTELSIMLRNTRKRCWDKLLTINETGKERVKRMRRMQRAC